MALTLEQHFANWESHVFGFGYGTGEGHILPALKEFFGAIGDERGRHGYDYEKLEAAVGPVTAWLLINTMCRADVFEYGTSPRYGWLTPKGERLLDFIASMTAGELVTICTEFDNDQTHCAPDVCNCGPGGYEKGRQCDNPFYLP